MLQIEILSVLGFQALHFCQNAVTFFLTCFNFLSTPRPFHTQEIKLEGSLAITTPAIIFKINIFVKRDTFIFWKCLGRW